MYGYTAALHRQANVDAIESLTGLRIYVFGVPVGASALSLRPALGVALAVLGLVLATRSSTPLAGRLEAVKP
jgi:hypothetical protein